MARNRKRQANSSVWYRKFDDSWYATIDGKRAKLRGEVEERIKGKDNRQQAGLAIARVKLQIEPVAKPQRLEFVLRQLTRQPAAHLVAELPHPFLHQ